MMKTTICNFKRDKGERKKRKKDGLWTYGPVLK